jgi:hypothetical protein
VIGQRSAREGDVAVKIKTIGPRKAFYLAHIDLVVTFMLRLPEGTRDALVPALRAWQGKVGQKGGVPYQPREGDEKAVRKLLKDAKRGER